MTTKQGNSFKGQLVGVGGVPVESMNTEPDEYEKKEGIVIPPKTGAPGAGQDWRQRRRGAEIGRHDHYHRRQRRAGDDRHRFERRRSKFADPTFDELKEWVTGTDGLKAEMCRKIAQVVKMPMADVQKIFDGRLARDMRTTKTAS